MVFWICPFFRTMMRSQIAKTSDSSEEMKRTLFFSLAKLRMIRMISVFAPMSTPAVGSSISRIFGSFLNHLAMTIFC